ncbi:MAG: metallophosphoesterase [Oscillospiraceae bacterium]|nr:metallophosphoesterase [Oscillospiraceae bacterium]
MKKHQNYIYITGDTHGDFTRFKKLKRLRKGDFLIVCGDFGFIWSGTKKEKRMLKRLGRRKFHILFVDGLHENFSELNSYPEEEWNGGMTRKISGNLRYLMRGEIFTLGGRTLLAFGGGRLDEEETLSERIAESELETLPEIPKESEYRNGLQAITRHGGKVDYIVSHEAPCKIAEFLELPNSDKSRANAYLDILGESCSFERWFFGNHHINKVVTSKYYALFDRVMRSDEVIKYNQ